MEVKSLRLSSVIPSPMNPRKSIDPESIQELADSIEAQGLLQPITVRPISNPEKFARDNGLTVCAADYEVVCGERRYRAMCQLWEKWEPVFPKTGESFSTIPAIIREMTDGEALDAMITENLQRKDVDPIEEGRSFKMLLDRGQTVGELSARFGKSPRYIQARIKLVGLIPELAEALREGRLAFSAAYLIAPLTARLQTDFHKTHRNLATVSASIAKSYLDGLFLTLTGSTWFRKGDLDYRGGCQRSCSECPCNTANQGCLFGDIYQDSPARCVDRLGFTQKAVAYATETLEKASDHLLKTGEPTTGGKTVVVLPNVYDSILQSVSAAVRNYCDANGYVIASPYGAGLLGEVNNPQHPQKQIAGGRICRALKVFDGISLSLTDTYFSINTHTDTGTSLVADTRPAEVRNLATTYAFNEDELEEKLIRAAAEAYCEHADFTKSPKGLSQEEFNAFYALILSDCSKLLARLGKTVDVSTPEKRMQWVDDNPDKVVLIIREWLRCQIGRGFPGILAVCRRHLAALSRQHCPGRYDKAVEAVRHKHQAAQKKLADRLASMGYGTDGKPLQAE